MTLTRGAIDSPIGRILLAFDDLILCAVEFADCRNHLDDFLRRQYAGEVPASGDTPLDVARRITSYFAGDVDALDAIPVRMKGTDFQRRVWTALRGIPPGTTISYACLAARVGAPRSVRAAGAANGANPISLVVPCHRVIGTNGKLTGYGGGLARKAWLIRHEAEALRRRESPPVPCGVNSRGQGQPRCEAAAPKGNVLHCRKRG